MIMRRSIVMTIICMGLVGLSCQFLPSSETPVRDTLAANAATPSSSHKSESAARAGLEQRILDELHRLHTGLSERDRVALAKTIVEEATLHGLDPALVLAVIRVESGGYHLAVSPVGAMGLMQLLPTTAEELARKLDVAWRGPDSLFDPIVNVKLGTAYLRQLSDRYDHMPTALAAYNWGPGRIDRRLRRGISVPKRYPGLVMKIYDEREIAEARRS